MASDAKNSKYGPVIRDLMTLIGAERERQMRLPPGAVVEQDGGLLLNTLHRALDLLVDAKLAEIAREAWADTTKPPDPPAVRLGRDELLAGLARVQRVLCSNATDGAGGPCDCKYGAAFSGEQSGCPEVRQAIADLREADADAARRAEAAAERVRAELEPARDLAERRLTEEAVRLVHRLSVSMCECLGDEVDRAEAVVAAYDAVTARRESGGRT